MSLMHGSEIRGRNEAAGIREKPRSFNLDARIERPRGEGSGATSSFSPDKRVEVYHGGAYKDVFIPGGEREAHHIPANEVNGLETRDGPCISMDVKDHRKTAGWGRSKEAGEYREKQKELIEAGDFKAALKMDIDDILFSRKFEDAKKYEAGLHEAADYAESMGLIPDQEGLWDAPSDCKTSD